MITNIAGVFITLNHSDLLNCKNKKDVSALNHFEHLDKESREKAENLLCKELGIKLKEDKDKTSDAA